MRTEDLSRLGTLRGTVHPVKTEDGLMLHAEVDDGHEILLLRAERLREDPLCAVVQVRHERAA